MGPIWPIATTILVAFNEILGEGVLINDCTPSSRLSLASMQLLQHTEEEHTSDEQYMYCTRGIHPAPPCMRQLHMCLHCNTGSHIERSPQLVDTAEKEVLV